jgi:hypothetical protein
MTSLQPNRCRGSDYDDRNEVDELAKRLKARKTHFETGSIWIVADQAREGSSLRNSESMWNGRCRVKEYKFFLGIRSALMLALLLTVTSPAIGQVEAGRFVGRITDAQGAVVPKARVKATNVGTNIGQQAITNPTGDYVITPVSPGQYVLSVTAPGFQTLTTSAITVQVGQIVREDLALKVGSSTTTIEVTALPPLLSTDSATEDTVMTNQHYPSGQAHGYGMDS